jgi:TnpA family transposase
MISVTGTNNGENVIANTRIILHKEVGFLISENDIENEEEKERGKEDESIEC